MTEYTFEASLEGIEFERIELIRAQSYAKCSIEASQGKVTLSFQTNDSHFESKTLAQLGVYATRYLERLCFKHKVPARGLHFMGYSEPKRDGVGRTLVIEQAFIYDIVEESVSLGPESRVALKDFLEESESPRDSLYSLYGLAIQQASPISKFMILYNIVLTLCNDSQREVDAFIERNEPEVTRTPSPRHPRQTETKYRRLRNEIAHKRAGVDLQSTSTEVEAVLPRFLQHIGKAIEDLA